MSTDRDSLKVILASLDQSIAKTLEDKEAAETVGAKAVCNNILADLDQAKRWAVNKLKQLP